VSAACPDLTPEELTKLFNKPIKSARFVGRKGSWSGVAGRGFHVGVEVTLHTNERWLIHHTDDTSPWLPARQEPMRGSQTCPFTARKRSVERARQRVTTTGLSLRRTV
jgi:hypothetical protein